MNMASRRLQEQEQDDGKKRILLPKQLSIIWSKDSRYWRFHDESAAATYAQLLQVCWLQVTGKFEGLAPNKKFSLGFTISFNQDTFGFDNCPVFLMAKAGNKGINKWKKITLDSSKRAPFHIPDQQSAQLIVETLPDETTLHVGLYEVWNGKWKGGLNIHSAFAHQLSD